MSRMFILGTAGHIDHGKTSLVRSLTGTDTDRLPEEKSRRITIDIGFAELDLGAHVLGVVDVPGHERFIKNMLAGASGIDLAMLVVAADDSVMPQTREHLAILELLQVRYGLVAMTKIDLVESSWQDLVEQEIRELIDGTFLENASIVRTSAVSGFGLDELQQQLKKLCDRINPESPDSVFRMAVDRSFAPQGLGTIITGTVWQGQVQAGQRIEWLPHQKELRIRGIQSHARELDQVHEGQRAALNIPDVHYKEVRRGDELASPGYLHPSRLLTVRLSVLLSSPWSVKHRARLRLYIGTQELMVSVALLKDKAVRPGESALAQLACSDAAIACCGQPFVVRSESPLVTLGGGIVLQPLARRISRRDEQRIKALDQLASPEELNRAETAIYFYGTADWSDLDLCRDACLRADRVGSLLDRMEADQILIRLVLSPKRTARVHREVFVATKDHLIQAVCEFHERSPLSVQISRDQIVQRLSFLGDKILLNKLLDTLVEAGELRGSDDTVAHQDFVPSLTGAQKRIQRLVANRFESAVFKPPGTNELATICRIDESEIRLLLQLCVVEGELIHLGGDFYLHEKWERELRQRVTVSLRQHAQLTTGQIKQLLKTSRKYAVPYCEYLDRLGLTHRQGDVRVLASAKKS